MDVGKGGQRYKPVASSTEFGISTGFPWKAILRPGRDIISGPSFLRAAAASELSESAFMGIQVSSTTSGMLGGWWLGGVGELVMRRGEMELRCCERIPFD
jgi:hypothetical protein